MVEELNGNKSWVIRDPLTGHLKFYYKGHLYGTLKYADMHNNLVNPNEIVKRWIDKCQADAEEDEKIGQLGGPNHPLTVEEI